MGRLPIPPAARTHHAHPPIHHSHRHTRTLHLHLRLHLHLHLHLTPAQDNQLDFYVCLSSEIVLFSGVLFQQTAGPDCDTDGADVAPGASLIREALGWINVGYTPDTTLQPHASTLQPHVSTLQPYTSTLQPCASTLQPYPQPLPCVYR